MTGLLSISWLGGDAPPIGSGLGRRGVWLVASPWREQWFTADVEHLIQSGYFKHLVNLGTDVAQDQLSPHGVEVLVDCQQHAQGRADQPLDLLEVQQDSTAGAAFLDELTEFFTYCLCGLVVQEWAIDQGNDGPLA